MIKLSLIWLFEQYWVRSFIILFLYYFSFVLIEVTVQLYRGLAAGGAGSFCDCVVARRGLAWCGQAITFP